jgi:hypothetical protein
MSAPNSTVRRTADPSRPADSTNREPRSTRSHRTQRQDMDVDDRRGPTMRGVRLAAAGLSLALAAGCTSGPQRQPGVAAPAGQASPSASEPGGSPTSSSSASPDPGPTGVNAPGHVPGRPAHGDIEQYERPGQAGASQLARLGLTNVGARCTMSGYVGLQLLAANGQPRETGVTHCRRPSGACHTRPRPDRLGSDRLDVHSRARTRRTPCRCAGRGRPQPWSRRRARPGRSGSRRTSERCVGTARSTPTRCR